MTIFAMLLTLPAAWLIFLTFYASWKFFKWLRKWNP